MIPSVDVPDLRVSEVLADCERRLSVLCPRDGALVRRTLQRLEPGRWVLEWRLPWWLGQTFGLDPEVAEDVVLANVLGLVAIRLEDDLRDGEVCARDVLSAERVQGAAFDEALGVLGVHAPPSSPLWPMLGRWMAEWRTASSNARPEGGAPDLAGRAAPLKVGAFAVCLLAGRLDAWPLTESAVDHVSMALVLLDQMADWELDVAAGRWNAFVASATDREQRLEDAGRVAVDVRVALLSRGAAAAYLRRVETEARAAESAAGMLRCESLRLFAADLARRARRHAAELDTVHAALAEAGAAAIVRGRGELARHAAAARSEALSA